MRALAVMVVGMLCRDDRYGELEQRTYELEKRLRDMPEPVAGKWWCAPASCDRDRTACDAAEAALVRDSATWPRPIVLQRCIQQATAWGDGGGKWLGSLRECQAIASDPAKCVGVE